MKVSFREEERSGVTRLFPFFLLPTSMSPTLGKMTTSFRLIHEGSSLSGAGAKEERERSREGTKEREEEEVG